MDPAEDMGTAAVNRADRSTKTGCNWWVLAGLVVLPLGLYVGAYYALVRPLRLYSFATEGSYMSPQYSFEQARPFFWPIHEIDRRLRPQVWDPRP